MKMVFPNLVPFFETFFLEYPVARFTREKIRISFISPHFTPWDELFELDETGNWNLAWGWRIADVDDYLKNKK